MNELKDGSIWDEIEFTGKFSEIEFINTVIESEFNLDILRQKVKNACEQLLDVLLVIEDISAVAMMVDHYGRNYSILMRRH